MPSERQPVRFGVFEVNLETGEVRRAGVKVKLQEQPFQVLAALLEKPGEVVTKEELQERIWKDDTFVDFDRSLATAVNKVRQALGDSAVRPRYIETVAKRGYRFIGANADFGLTAVQGNYVSISRRRLIALLASSLVVGFALAGLMLLRRSNDRSEPRIRRYSMTAEGMRSPIISPDGNYVAYISQDDVVPATLAQGSTSPVTPGRRRLWLRSLASADPVELAGTDGAEALFWSPDSASIAFVTRGQKAELKRISIEGGALTTVCELPSRSVVDYFLGGSWSPDGEVIVFVSGGRLFHVSALGGQPEAVLPAEGNGPRVLRDPHFLPVKGEMLVIYAASVDFHAERSLAALNLKTGEVKEIGPGRKPVYSPEGYLIHEPPRVDQVGLWALPFSISRLEATGGDILLEPVGSDASLALDGTLAFQSQPSDEMQLKSLTWVDRTGRLVGRAGQPQRGLREFAISPDERWVAVTVDEPSDIWIQDLQRGAASRLSFDPGFEYMPTWSPSGKEVAYTIQGDLRQRSALVRKNADGTGEPSEIAVIEGGVGEADWAANGRYILFSGSSRSGVAPDIHYVELSAGASGSENKTFLSSPAAERAPKLSFDGRFIAYVSDESGRPEVYIQPFPGGGRRWQASVNGGIQPRWSRDGTELFYVEGNDALMAVSVAFGDPLVLGQPQELFRSPDLAFRNQPQPQYLVSQDARRFLLSTPTAQDRTPALNIVENWFEDFKKRTLQ